MPGLTTFLTTFLSKTYADLNVFYQNGAADAKTMEAIRQGDSFAFVCCPVDEKPINPLEYRDI